jgi:dTDP-D-glucose 4,6-dehydratase
MTAWLVTGGAGFIGSNFVRMAADSDVETALPALVRWYLDHKDWTDAVRTGAHRQYYDRQYAGR